MPDAIGEFIARFKARAIAALDAGGAVAQAGIEQAISTPVKRDAEGNVTERSAPGEPPRLESGQLHGNVQHKTFDSGNIVGVTVGVSRPETPSAPVELEFGTSRVRPRPFMRPAMDRFAASDKQVVISALE